MPKSRRTRLVLGVAGVLLAAPVVAIVVLLNYDWNQARPWLNAKIGEAIDRPFEIHGALALTWQRQGSSAQDRSWSDYLPLPHLVANDVHLGNPATLPARGYTPSPGANKDARAMPLTPTEMASVGQLSFAIELLPLLQQRIAIPVLRFERPFVLLRRDADGGNNWTFKPAAKPSPWRLDLQRVVFTKGTVQLLDAVQKIDASAAIDTISDPAYGVAWTLRGRWNGQPLTGGGKAGAVLSLQAQTAPYPLAADVAVGGTRIAVVGTLTRPTALAALDLRLKLSGPSMARLYPLTGVLLPETPAFTTEGRLLGSLGRGGSRWTYEKFTGKVGASDIAGKLSFETGRPRPRLSGAVSSTLLQLSDLGPLIGADSNASKQARGVAAVQPGDKVLPVETFKTERWTALDADVGFQAKRLVRGADLPIHNLDTVLHLKDGVLALTPLNFDVAGGKFKSDIKLDGSGKLSADAIRAELKASASHIKLKQLLPALDGMPASVGEINADIALSATGNSVASLLASANGEVKGVVNQGTVSKLLLEELGLNIGNVLLAKLAGDKQVKLNCMVSEFGVERGLMRTRRFVLDTEDSLLNVSGTVNLANERLDLTLKPDSRGLRVFSLRAPIYVHGSFKQPDFSIDKGVLALRAGGALALAVVAPVAAVVPLLSTGPDHPSGCARLLAEAAGKAVAPPPGQRPAARRSR
ncbi:AsmA family protein [Rugamonas sp. CCM 8940]|uniref:AsmA family protein n=1 Tax=Rugamonas sp. CCM 8940 TaxID=2765359 RepID=UPI0018F578EE|nr:AsmA family protein [Rugamonas sp. CCM 8940]MBJ7309255.1 AsmA family protein [Rugamonas sp. CCM 8940]